MSLAKLSRLQTHTFDPLNVQLLRIRKRQWLVLASSGQGRL